MQQTKEYFDNHTSADILYFTSDNLAFFEEQNAKNHAKRLGDDIVTVKTRAEVEAEAVQLYNDSLEGYDPLDEPDAE